MNKLSKKLNLHQQQSFQLCELFFIKQTAVFDKVKFGESEDIERELVALLHPIAQLYYAERLFLIQAVTALISSATADNSSSQGACLDFYKDKLEKLPMADVVWDQYTDMCGLDVPSEIYAPSEREVAAAEPRGTKGAVGAFGDAAV